MQIQSYQADESFVLRLTGRLDANWAEYVGKAIESAVQAGQHSIDLDLAEVDYLSSAGIRILVKAYGQLKAARGRLRVQHATPNVLSVLQLSGLVKMLVVPSDSSAAAAKSVPPAASAGEQSTRWDDGGVSYERYGQAGSQSLECHCYGTPERFASGQLVADESTSLAVGGDTYCLGLGAFGSSGQDAQARFGESLAAAGVAVTQPTDGSSVPDFQLTQGDLVPELRLLYGLSVHGRFPCLLRFEASQSERGSLSFSHLVRTAFKELKSPAAAFVMLVESDAVIGATVLQSPATAAGTSPWSLPAVRDWLSFTSEPSDDRNLLLIVGVVVDSPNPTHAQFLRPFGLGPGLLGHFHAAVFPYRPLAKGQIELSRYIHDLFTTDAAQAVLHLIADDRQFEGCGETELSRGACWYGPLHLHD